MFKIIQFHSKSKKTELPFSETAMKDLSNFSSFDVEYDNHVYPTVEHAFQALKYSCTEKPELVDVIREQYADKDAIAAKSSGGKGAMKKLKVNLDINCWNTVKDEIMKKLIASKISRHPEIRQIIDIAREHNYRLVHFSRSDMYWGAHVNESGTEIKDGLNKLGEIYMGYYHQEKPANKEKAKRKPKSEKTKTKKIKVCPDDKIINPETNRCVSKTSKIGKAILNKMGVVAVPKKKKMTKKEAMKDLDKRLAVPAYVDENGNEVIFK